MDSKQRKLLNSFYISGTALVAFSVLDAVKLVLYFVLDPMQRAILAAYFEANNALGWTIVGIIGGATLLEVLLGCFVGLSARSEAKGKKRNIFYVVVAIILATLLLFGAVFTLVEAFLTEITVWSILSALITSGITGVVVYALVDVVVCSIKLRKLNKQNNTKDGEGVILNEEVIF